MADLKMVKGETPTFHLTVTRINHLLPSTDPDYETEVDLRGQKVWFTAKRRLSDAAAAIAKGTAETGLSGVTVDAGDPGNKADLRLAAADTDFATETVQLAYDVKVELDGTEDAVVQSGTLTIELGVS